MPTEKTELQWMIERTLLQGEAARKHERRFGTLNKMVSRMHPARLTLPVFPAKLVLPTILEKL